MFRAIGRYFRALGYLVTGNIDKARESVSRNPAVVRATYAEIVREKSSRIREYTGAVAGLVTQEEKKKQRVSQLTDEIKRLEDLKAGALAKAKKRAQELQAAGKTTEQIHHDEDYLKCRAAFSDFSSTLKEKQDRIAELEGEIGEYGKKIASHKVQLQQLVRELDKLKSEADEAVADMITAKEETDIAQMLSGISEDGTAQQLSEMRELRHKAKAEARVASEIAGTDTKAQEAEFLAYARSGEADGEFDALIGLAEQPAAEVSAAPKGAEKKEQLPQ
jgi:chromosome segregation ATPase